MCILGMFVVLLAEVGDDASRDVVSALVDGFELLRAGLVLLVAFQSGEREDGDRASDPEEGRYAFVYVLRHGSLRVRA